MTTKMTDSDTSITDPWSEHAQWINAKKVREAWMEMMGMDEEEIRIQCQHDPPTDLDEELSQYNAIFQIQSANSRSAE